MDNPSRLSPVEVLVLTRLLPVGEKGETAAKIRKDLEPLLEYRWSGGVLNAVLDRSLIKLVSTELIAALPIPEKGRRKGKASEPKYVLTTAGKQRGLDLLGVASLGPKTTWAALKKSLLPAHALGLRALDAAALKKLGTEGGFKAALLRSLFELPLDGCPTLAQATDALAWKLIGFSSAEKFSIGAVQKALFQRAVGETATRPGDVKKTLDLLLAARVGARRNAIAELRDALLRGWVDRRVDGEEASHPSRPLEPTAPVATDGQADPKSFAEYVLEAARTCPTGRYGDNKVFVVHVWRTVKDLPSFRRMDFPTFKRHLAEANNARLLDLSRADLVQAMDPEDVKLSEVRYLNATFHFIRVDPERR